MLLALAAFLPTAVIGFLLHGIVKYVLLGSTPVVLWSLAIGGAVLILFERWKPARSGVQDVSQMSLAQAVLIGLCQSIAIVPGVSRSAATIVGGELLGISRKAIVEFSFLLAIPTMAAATGYDLLQTASQFTLADMKDLLLGFVLSFIVALFAIKWFLGFVKNHSFVVFGLYRICLALAFWMFAA
jgi:undecaprenyl-diphosphatase